MKIKLAVFMSDKTYLSRFTDMVTVQYADKIELSVFTQAEGAAEIIAKSRPDIVLAEQAFLEQLPVGSSTSELVCFTDQKGVREWNGYQAICKYQKLSDIYRNIAAIYAAKIEAEAMVLKGDAESKKIITFFSGAGGVGASTAAAAYAYRLAEQGEQVLYLNLEQAGAADLFFSAGGEDDFGKVIYSLAMAAGSPAVRMESALRQDASGVYFYAACPSALDMAELSQDMMERMFEQLSVLSLFRWIIVDMDFQLDTRTYMQIERSYAVFFVSDGSDMANAKLKRKLDALEIMAQQREKMLLNRIFILYNRFSSKSGKKLQGSAFKEIGGIHRFADAGAGDLLKLLAQSEVFQEIQQC